MRRIQIVVSSLLLVALLVSCAPKEAPAPAPQVGMPAAAPQPQAPAREAWEMEWEKVVEAGKKEGKVVILSSLGGEVPRVLGQAFKNKYGISAEFVCGKGAELSEKLFTERRAGLHLSDIYTGGTTTLITILKPSGALAPLKPALILPEVTDPKVWWSGNLLWVDKEGQYVLAYLAFPNIALLVNTEMVKPGEIKSFKDLLNHKWDGKIVWNDPTVQGVAPRIAAAMFRLMGTDYVRELTSRDPIVIRDQRLQVEWVARGKYPITLAVKPEIAKVFADAGAPIQVVTPEEGIGLSTGSGALTFVDKAAHPNAAKVYINWILSKEGQTICARAYNGSSARLDVPLTGIDPNCVRQEGVKYYWEETEDFLVAQPNLMTQMKEFLAPYMK